MQDILQPDSALHAFAVDLRVIAPNPRVLIVPLPIAATAAETDISLGSRASATWNYAVFDGHSICAGGCSDGYRIATRRVNPAARRVVALSALDVG